MGKYRKKPVVIEAVQWTGSESSFEDIRDLNKKGRKLWIAPSGWGVGDSLYIQTLEGVMEASIDDYIIKGVQGELYPCKPDIFKQTYEEV